MGNLTVDLRGKTIQIYWLWWDCSWVLIHIFFLSLLDKVDIEVRGNDETFKIFVGERSSKEDTLWREFKPSHEHRKPKLQFNLRSPIWVDILLLSSSVHLANQIRGAFNEFPDFFVQAFKIVVDSWKFTMLLLYILWDDWPILMISALNEQLQLQFEYTILKPDCHSWGISKIQSGREDTLEEPYAIKFCFKLGKNATVTYRMLQTGFGASCMNRAWVFEWHKRFKEVRESVRDDERCGRSKEVNTSQLIGQRVGLELLCWSFKGVQEEIPWEAASTFQIESVTFSSGQCTSPQLHPCHRLFDQDGHQDSSTPSL